MKLHQRPSYETAAHATRAQAPGKRFRRTPLLIVGCGDVGLRAAKLLKGRLRLFGTTRSSHKKSLIESSPAQAIVLDLNDPIALLRACRLSTRIMMLAPPPNQGSFDPHSLRLLQALNKARAQRSKKRIPNMKPRVVYVSTTGVYGGVNGATINETAPLNPSTDRAKRRVAAEHVWRAAARKNQIELNVLRAPGIYALERLPIDRLHAKTPALIDADDVFTNHIHADDLARLCIRAALLEPGKLSHRIFNSVDASHLKMGEYFDAVADHFGLLRPTRLPREQLAAQVSPMMLSFMSESRKIVGDRVLNEFTMKLRYPTVSDFLSALSSNNTDATTIKIMAQNANNAPL